MKISFNNKINFGTRTDVIAQSDKFIDDIYDKDSKHKMNFSQIKSEINGFVPQVDVLKMKHSDKRRKYTYGFFASGVQPDKDTFCLINPLLALNVPIFRTEKNHKELLSTAVHETTHALQSQDEEMSRVNVYKKYLQSKNPKVINMNISAAKDFYVEIFSAFLADMHTLLSGHGDLSETMLLLNNLSNNINVFKKDDITQLLDAVVNIYPESQRGFIKDSEYLMALQEADAYAQEAKIRKKLKLPCGVTNFKSQVYSMLADTLSDIE